MKTDLNGLLEEAMRTIHEPIKRGILIAKERGLVSGECVERGDIENVFEDAIQSFFAEIYANGGCAIDACVDIFNEVPEESDNQISSESR
jgi:hypothetical protein